MRNYILFYILAFTFVFYACETSEDISNQFDHEVPSYEVHTDSISVPAGQSIDIKVTISDNAGLKKIVFMYSNWSILESISLESDNYPKAYMLERTITIPNDAEKVWQEEIILNDGSKNTVAQQYHKLIIEATDINMNTRKIPVYVKIE